MPSFQSNALGRKYFARVYRGSIAISVRNYTKCQVPSVKFHIE